MEYTIEHEWKQIGDTDDYNVWITFNAGELDQYEGVARGLKKDDVGKRTVESVEKRMAGEYAEYRKKFNQ